MRNSRGGSRLAAALTTPGNALFEFDNFELPSRAEMDLLWTLQTGRKNWPAASG
jgi:hypothetical protein